MLNFQEAIYPANYNKLRFLENHDQPRICSVCEERTVAPELHGDALFPQGHERFFTPGRNLKTTIFRASLKKSRCDRQTGKDLTPLPESARERIKRALGVPKSFFRAEADDANDVAVMQRAGDTGAVFVGVFSLKRRERRSPRSRPSMACMKTCWAEPPSPSQPEASPVRASL